MGWTRACAKWGQKGGVAGRAHTGAGDGTGFLWQVSKGSCERGGLEEQKEDWRVRRDFRRQQRLGGLSDGPVVVVSNGKESEGWGCSVGSCGVRKTQLLH